MNITLPNGVKLDGEVDEVLNCMRKLNGEKTKKSSAKGKKAKIKLDYLGLQAEGKLPEILKLIEGIQKGILAPSQTINIVYTGHHYWCVTCQGYHTGHHCHEYVWCTACLRWVTGPHGLHTNYYPWWNSPNYTYGQTILTSLLNGSASAGSNLNVQTGGTANNTVTMTSQNSMTNETSLSDGTVTVSSTTPIEFTFQN